MVTWERMQMDMMELMVLGFERCVLEGERIFEFAIAHNLVVSNSLFTKGHLVTYQSGENQSQIHCILVKQQDIKLVHELKVIPIEVCVTQQKKKLLVCDVRIVKSEDWCKKCVPKQCVWKLRWADLCD